MVDDCRPAASAVLCPMGIAMKTSTLTAAPTGKQTSRRPGCPSALKPPHWQRSAMSYPERLSHRALEMRTSQTVAPEIPAPTARPEVVRRLRIEGDPMQATLAPIGAFAARRSCVDTNPLYAAFRIAEARACVAPGRSFAVQRSDHKTVGCLTHLFTGALNRGIWPQTVL